VAVDMDETDETSESPSFDVWKNNVVAIVSDLFFLGNGGRTLPGISCRSCLCKRLKSPYRLPTKCSSSPFLLIRRMNSYT
jgi:hypothetical protein